MGYPVKEISTKYYPLDVDGQERFYGIEARGRAHVVDTVFDLVKKDGDWYLRTGGEDGDVKVDALQPAQPECPNVKY